MRSTAVLLLLFSAFAGRADTLHLRDGTRYSGRLIRETPAAVVFRVTLGNADSGTVQEFPRGEVLRVERTGTIESPIAAPVAARDTHSPRRIEQMLREGFELAADEDLESALRAVQAAILAADEQLLKRLDLLTRDTQGAPLDEFVAGLRLRFAFEGRYGRTFDLRSATPYEAEALARRLTELIESRLAREYQDRTLRDWSVDIDAYDSLRSDAPRLVADARTVAAAILARLRFDRTLRSDREARTRLVVLRGDLARLAAHVAGLDGFTALGARAMADDPTLEVAREIELYATSQPATQPADERPAVRDPFEDAVTAGAGDAATTASDEPEQPSTQPTKAAVQSDTNENYSGKKRDAP